MIGTNERGQMSLPNERRSVLGLSLQPQNFPDCLYLCSNGRMVCVDKVLHNEVINRTYDEPDPYTSRSMGTRPETFEIAND